MSRPAPPSSGCTQSSSFEGETEKSAAGDGEAAAAATRVEHFGGSALGVGRTGVILNGWRIETIKGLILTGKEEERWQSELGAFRLPEMVFGGSRLELEHLDSGATISFNARDALRAWKAAKLPPVKVPAAAAWAEMKRPAQECILDYDYTFSTPYKGTLSWRLKRENSTSGSSVQTAEPAAVRKGEDEGGNIVPGSSGLSQEAEQGEDQSQASKSCQPVWARDDSASIDWALLKRRDPILFFDEVILYEDELADSGIAMLSVRVRVMPHCWFALLRFWLRVDGAMMRAYETRLFCRFPQPAGTECQSPEVVREYIEREDTFTELAKKGLPREASEYQDPDVAVPRLTPRTMLKSVLQLPE